MAIRKNKHVKTQMILADPGYWDERDVQTQAAIVEWVDEQEHLAERNDEYCDYFDFGYDKTDFLRAEREAIKLEMMVGSYRWINNHTDTWNCMAVLHDPVFGGAYEITISVIRINRETLEWEVVYGSDSVYRFGSKGAVEPDSPITSYPFFEHSLEELQASIVMADRMSRSPDDYVTSR